MDESEMPAPTTNRRGLTVLELLIAIFTAMVIATLVLPAIGAARESARLTTCVNNLRELGLAAANYHAQAGALPTGLESTPSGNTAYGWAVPLLQYSGYPELYDSIDRELPVGHPANNEARVTTVSLMLCPSDLTENRFMLFENDDGRPAVSTGESWNRRRPILMLPTSNYVGVHGTREPDDRGGSRSWIQKNVHDGAFQRDQQTRFSDFQRGRSQTFLVGERRMSQASSTWYGVDLSGEDAAARIMGAAVDGINTSNGEECDFSSRHTGGSNFLFADGHVKLVSEEIDIEIYQRLARLRMNESD